MMSDNKMWLKLLTVEAMGFMIRVSNEGKEEDGTTENELTIMDFFNWLKKNFSYKTLVVLATQWHKYDEKKQVLLAIYHAGNDNASKMMMLMDYLSLKYQRGELM